jgi:hypothetical protein
MKPMDELDWLAAFWLAVRNIPERHMDHRGVRAARLNALQQVAAVALFTPTPEQIAELRREQVTLTEERLERECFVCGGEPRERIWHHVMLLSHGGTNHKHNLVLLCAGCHAEVHPWLWKEPSASEGFVLVGRLIGALSRKMAQAKYRQEKLAREVSAVSDMGKQRKS